MTFRHRCWKRRIPAIREMIWRFIHPNCSIRLAPRYPNTGSVNGRDHCQRISSPPGRWRSTGTRPCARGTSFPASIPRMSAPARRPSHGARWSRIYWTRGIARNAHESRPSPEGRQINHRFPFGKRNLHPRRGGIAPTLSSRGVDPAPAKSGSLSRLGAGARAFPWPRDSRRPGNGALPRDHP